MQENIPVPEFNETEIELINALKEKGFCPETQALFCAWEDAEQAKPEWESVKYGEEDKEKDSIFLLLQAWLELKKTKILNEAHMPIEDLEEALRLVYQKIDGIVVAEIDCQDLQDEYFKLANKVDVYYSQL